MKIDPNEPVYPMLEPSFIEGLYSLRARGMTIRTQIAAGVYGHILAEVMRRRNEAGYTDRSAIIEAADLADFAADALIHRLNKDQPSAH